MRNLFLFLGNICCWLGHFFLIGFPLLLMVLGLLFYKDNEFPGIILLESILFAAPIAYKVGGALKTIGGKIPQQQTI